MIFPDASRCEEWFFFWKGIVVEKFGVAAEMFDGNTIY